MLEVLLPLSTGCLQLSLPGMAKPLHRCLFEAVVTSIEAGICLKLSWRHPRAVEDVLGLMVKEKVTT